MSWLAGVCTCLFVHLPVCHRIILALVVVIVFLEKAWLWFPLVLFSATFWHFLVLNCLPFLNFLLVEGRDMQIMKTLLIIVTLWHWHQKRFSIDFSESGYRWEKLEKMLLLCTVVTCKTGQVIASIFVIVGGFAILRADSNALFLLCGSCFWLFGVFTLFLNRETNALQKVLAKIMKHEILAISMQFSRINKIKRQLISEELKRCLYKQ